MSSSDFSPRGAAVDDHAAEVSQAARALVGVFAAQHFKNGVDAFAVGEIPDGFFVVILFVVDAMLQAEFRGAREFVVRRRSAVHFHAEQFADLHCCCAHAAGDGVNQDTRAHRSSTGVSKPAFQ